MDTSNMTEEERKRKQQEDAQRAKMLGSGMARNAADKMLHRKKQVGQRLRDIMDQINGN